MGQMAAMGVMAGILLGLTVLLLGVLACWREEQIIPDSRRADMERYEYFKRRNGNAIERAGQSGASAIRDFAVRQPDAEDEESCCPVMIGNPSSKSRRMSILELGAIIRWSQIRRRNKLVDELSLEGRHPNLAPMG